MTPLNKPYKKISFDYGSAEGYNWNNGEIAFGTPFKLMEEHEKKKQRDTNRNKQVREKKMKQKTEIANQATT